MKNGNYLSLLALLLLNVNASAQTQKVAKRFVQPIQMDQKVPDFVFKNLINYPEKIISLHDLKGKLVIADFWTTGCVSCVESFPKLHSLQQQFGEKIQIILINPWQTLSEVNRAFEKRKSLAHYTVTIPSSCADTNLLHLFPVSTVPHIVWIDKNGYLKSITAGSELTAENISSALQNQFAGLHQKDEFGAEYDLNKPLYINGNGPSATPLLWYSIFSKYATGLYPSCDMLVNKERGSDIYAVNQSITGMYAYAYSNFLDIFNRHLNTLPPNRIKLNLTDTSRYTAFINNKVAWQNLYCYQLVTPITTRERLLQYMRDDLDRYFGLKAHWIKEKKQCLVITADDTTFIAYHEGERTMLMNDVEFDINNVGVGEIVKWMETVTRYSGSCCPIIDETGYAGKLGHIKFTADFYDPSSLDSAFHSYKMHFRKEERIVDVLEINEVRPLPDYYNNLP